MAENEEVEELAVPQALTPLTTPCTITALRNWLKSVDVQIPGVGASVNVNTTATTIGAA
jgi:hypothetical protein